MNINSEQLQQILAGNQLFATMTDEEAQYLLAVGAVRSFDAGAQVFAVGSPGDELFLVLKGGIAVRMPSQEGDVLVEEFYAGDMLGEVAVLDAQARTATGIAAAPTDVLAIARDDVHAFLEQFPRYRQFLIAILARRLRRTSELVSEMLTPNTGGASPVEPETTRFATTIVGYGRYGNNYIGPKYAKPGHPWDVVAVVDPVLTTGQFAVSVLGRSKPATRIFRTFEEWRDGYFSQLAPEQQARQVIEIPLKPDVLYDQVMRYIDAGVKQFILPKPVVMNGAQLRDLTGRVAHERIKAAVASQWFYSDFPRIIAREIAHLSAERGGAHPQRVEIEFSKEGGLAYATPPPLLELPHVLQLLTSIGLIDPARDQPDVTGSATLVELAYHPPAIADGVRVRAGIDFQPSTAAKRTHPNWDYQERVLNVYFDADAPPALVIDFWIRFLRSGDVAIRPGRLRIADGARMLELQFVEDQLFAMNRAIYAAFDQPFDQFQRDERVLSLERYGPIGEQLMFVQAAWERAISD